MANGAINFGFRELPLLNFLLFVNGAWDVLVLVIPLLFCTNNFSESFFGGPATREAMGITTDSKIYDVLELHFQAIALIVSAIAGGAAMTGLFSSRSGIQLWYIGWFFDDVVIYICNLLLIYIIKKVAVESGRDLKLLIVMLIWLAFWLPAFVTLLVLGNGFVPQSDCNHRFYALNYILVIQGGCLFIASLACFFVPQKTVGYFVGGEDVLTRIGVEVQSQNPSDQFFLTVHRYMGGISAGMSIQMITVASTACRYYQIFWLAVFSITLVGILYPAYKMHKFVQDNGGQTRIYVALAVGNIISLIVYWSLIGARQFRQDDSFTL